MCNLILCTRGHGAPPNEQKCTMLFRTGTGQAQVEEVAWRNFNTDCRRERCKLPLAQRKVQIKRLLSALHLVIGQAARVAFPRVQPPTKARRLHSGAEGEFVGVVPRRAESHDESFMFYSGPLGDHSRYVTHWLDNSIHVTVTDHAEVVEDEAGITRANADSPWGLDEDAEELDKIGCRMVVQALLQDTRGGLYDRQRNEVRADVKWGF